MSRVSDLGGGTDEFLIVHLLDTPHFSVIISDNKWGFYELAFLHAGGVIVEYNLVVGHGDE